jgi:transposase InsO family protein
MNALIQEYKDLFPEELPAGLPPDRGVNLTIPLEEGTKPVKRPAFRYSPKEMDEIRSQVDFLLRKGLITESNSPFGAPVLFVPKPNGTLRMCIDYRALNKATIKNKWPIPRIDTLLDQLQGATIFSAIDLQQGYYQLRIDQADCAKTAFVTPLGLYEFKVLPFGLANAPAIFQQAMHHIFDEKIGKYVLVYLDDILVYSKTPEEHVQHLRKVLEVLRQQKLYCRLHKCHFNREEISYLGHLVSKTGIKPDPEGIEKVQNWPVPKCVKHVQQFLGLSNYFRKFIQGYSKLATPLTNLTRGDVPWSWTDKCQNAFEHIKECLVSAPLLKMPDPSRPFEVIADASLTAVGAVLMQDNHPICYASRKFIPAELNYSVTDKEALASIHAVQIWRCYLEGTHFNLVTDHCPLTYLKSQPQLSRRQARWSEILEQFDYKWEYRPGRKNVADPLSRIPASPEEQGAQRKSQMAICGICATRTRKARKQPNIGTEADDLAGRIQKAYAQEPRLEEMKSQQELQPNQGLWMRGEQVFVPTPLREEICQLAHDHPSAGHFGQDKTLDLVQRYYWWPGMSREVKHYVDTCLVCQQAKYSRQRTPGLLQPLRIPEQPWTELSMDFITQLPRTKGGHDAIAVFVDRLTKMVRVAATKTEVSAEGAADLLVQNVVRHHGLPMSIVSDRDVRFTSKFYRHLANTWGIKLNMSTAYHPQTDGQTEVMNRVLEDYLRSYTRATQDEWDELLAMAEFSMNNSRNSSTKETPFYLNYGRHPKSPLALGVEVSQSRSPVPPGTEARHSRSLAALGVKVRKPLKGYDNPNARSLAVALNRAQQPRLGVTGTPIMETVPAVIRFDNRIQTALKEARECLERARGRQSKYADRNRRDVTFDKGDDVLLSTKHITLKHPGTRKLLPRWIGPFTILDRVGQLAYKLQLPESMNRIHPVFHVSKLKPYKASGRVQPPPVPIEIEGELEYEVERILDKRTVKRSRRSDSVEYLVKWLGYGHEHNSWEPAQSVANAREIVQAFENGHIPVTGVNTDRPGRRPSRH